MKKIVALSALLMGLPLAASAGGVYVGAGIGNAHVQSTSFVGQGGEFDLSDNDLSFNLNLGYELNDNIALDLMYADWGDFTDTTNNNDERIRSSIDMFAISGVFSTALGDSFDLFGRLGIAFVSNDVSDVFVVDGTPVPGGSFSTDSEDMIYGFGADWNWDNFKVRVEADWLSNADFSKARNVSLTAIYKFNL